MSEIKGRHRESFVAGIIRENPLFVAVLGTCPALAITKSFEASIGMGLLFTFVLIMSNVLISLLRKLIPEEVRTPCYIVIIAAFVTVIKMLTNAFLPELYSSLGVFLSLLVVNCIVLGRAEAFASRNPVFDSFLDGVGNGIGYTLALGVIGLIREILGTGRLTFGKIFTFLPVYSIPVLRSLDSSYDFSMSFFANPAGGFLVFGLLLAILNAIHIHKTTKEKVRQRQLFAASLSEGGKTA
jgi:Na+-translocating ferredoxin:NAD+ oxidoreductase subunit E